MHSIELESAKLMSQFSGDRPCFTCSRFVPFSGMRYYQVLSLDEGLALINLRVKKAVSHPDILNVGAAAGVGRLLGGQAGSQLAQIAVIGFARAGEKTHFDQTYELASDEEIAAAMTKNRHSFCIRYESVCKVVIDKSKMFSDAAGLIRLKATGVGKIELAAVKVDDMLSAIDVFQRRFNDRVKVRVEFDSRKRRFVKRR